VIKSTYCVEKCKLGQPVKRHMQARMLLKMIVMKIPGIRKVSAIVGVTAAWVMVLRATLQMQATLLQPDACVLMNLIFAINR
jgi:hypothetical protein